MAVLRREQVFKNLQNDPQVSVLILGGGIANLASCLKLIPKLG